MERTDEKTSVDPVCGMVVSSSRARAVYSHGSTTYFFYSPNCRDCFKRDPDRYPSFPPIQFNIAAQAPTAADAERSPRG